MTKKNKVDQAVDAVVNTGSSLLDKVSSPSSRAGSTIERAARMAEAGVAKTAIAAQLSSGSATGHQYSTAEVDTMVVLFEDCKTKVPLTKKASQALINDAKDNICTDDDGVLV
ncbi:hypothetical protein [Klebsiella variicola]|uniref:hypothetical protein n=1 Tax=Klebsiella variicola TaxID=244366 RepID=UPI0008FAE8E7|nr:hypothetical protein [Klebsiella variicola]